MSQFDAERLQGQRLKYRVPPDSDPGHEAGFTLYDCTSQDKVHRSVWFTRRDGGRPAVEDEMIAEALLRILHHSARVAADGTRFEGVTEYRLVGARMVR